VVVVVVVLVVVVFSDGFVQRSWGWYVRMDGM